MKRRLGNIRMKKKTQGATPNRSKYYRQQLLQSPVIDNLPASNDDDNDDDDLMNVDDESSQTEKGVNQEIAFGCHEERIKVTLKKELAKKKSDATTVRHYMDILFNSRRKAIQQIDRVPARVTYVKEEYPSFLEFPNEVSIITCI